MSTYWNVHCAEHVAAEPLFPDRGVRNGDEWIRKFMDERQELIPLARHVARCADRVPWFEATFKACIGERFDVEFFDLHDLCPLVMRSDQGDEEALP